MALFFIVLQLRPTLTHYLFIKFIFKIQQIHTFLIIARESEMFGPGGGRRGRKYHSRFSLDLASNLTVALVSNVSLSLSLFT